MVTSAPFDDWWHNAYGLDVEILSPPHTVLGLGMVGIELGALLITVIVLNFLVPIAAIAVFGNKIARGKP